MQKYSHVVVVVVEQLLGGLDRDVRSVIFPPAVDEDANGLGAVEGTREKAVHVAELQLEWIAAVSSCAQQKTNIAIDIKVRVDVLIGDGCCENCRMRNFKNFFPYFALLLTASDCQGEND